ncbi:MAG: hypothetical protein WAW92_04075 [Minisyncoccia bacterium]
MSTVLTGKKLAKRQRLIKLELQMNLFKILRDLLRKSSGSVNTEHHSDEEKNLDHWPDSTFGVQDILNSRRQNAFKKGNRPTSDD